MGLSPNRLAHEHQHFIESMQQKLASDQHALLHSLYTGYPEMDCSTANSMREDEEVELRAVNVAHPNTF